jgi:hypothetical protein
MHTQWKDIPGYEGRYQASTDGQIRSRAWVEHIEPRNGKAAYDRQHKSKLLHPCVGSNGYNYVGLRESAKSKNAKYTPVHHLIALTFLGDRPDGAVICHWDGDKHNNKLDNLRYGTYRDNSLDTYRQGGRYGKLTPEQAKAIKIRLAKGDTQTQIAKDYDVTPAAIWYIAKGVRFSWLDA